MKTAWIISWLMIAAGPAQLVMGQAADGPGRFDYTAPITPHQAVSHDYYADEVSLESATATFAQDASAVGCCDLAGAGAACGCDQGGCAGCCGCGNCSGCGNCCGCGGGCGADRLWWLPIVRRSDHCFDGFISPMTNPVFFEDPRNLTEARLIFINHQLPPALGSGDVQVYAMQLRAALTERLSLIATKDGFLVGGNDAPLQDGWADVAAGLKYNLIADPQLQRLLSTGFTFELPVGSIRALQGNGDGVLNAFLTGGMQIGYNWHWISASGVRMPMNTLEEAPVMYWSNHLDRRVFGNWYVLAEVNWYNYLKDGRTAFSGINGIDLFNLGGRNIAGNDIVTGAFGGKWKPSPWTELGLAWENPLSSRKDILENRLTADWIIRY